MKTDKELSHNWGGKRPGAGRKAQGEALKKFPATLPREYVDALDEIAEAMGESRNSVLKRAVIAFLSKGKQSE